MGERKANLRHFSPFGGVTTDTAMKEPFPKQTLIHGGASISTDLSTVTDGRVARAHAPRFVHAHGAETDGALPMAFHFDHRYRERREVPQLLPLNSGILVAAAHDSAVSRALTTA